MFKWNPSRPFVIFDIEATGTNARTDRIVELSLVKILPAGTREIHTFRVNPQILIPAEATRIHGITDADVASCPLFPQIAGQVAALLENCDLGGYNLVRFDIPLLAAEFARAGVPFGMEGRRIIDAQRIFHRKEPRDLTAALSFYCNELHTNAHGAEADALATLRVLEGELDRYPDLPRDMDELDRYCNPRDPSWADRAGRLKWVNGEVVVNFGKKAGESLRTLVEKDSGFLKWLLKSDFPADTQEIVRHALQGRLPTPPSVSAPSGDVLGSYDAE